MELGFFSQNVLKNGPKNPVFLKIFHFVLFYGPEHIKNIKKLLLQESLGKTIPRNQRVAWGEKIFGPKRSNKKLGVLE